MATENHKGLGSSERGGSGTGGGIDERGISSSTGSGSSPLPMADCKCGCSDPSHVHTHDVFTLDVRTRGYDRPLIDSGDDGCACSCGHHPEDESSKAIVTQMVSQLDEVIALSSGPVYGEFMANDTLQLRLIDLLNKVQEEAISLPGDYKQRKTKADWEFLQTLNGQIIHPDLGMNPETLWDVVRLEIPYQHKMLGIIINGCSHEH